MEPDYELLRRYGHEGDESAFAEMVRRHTDLVYSVALRLVAGDAALAQDVAQSVFTALARKARALSHRPNLIGWLHTATRYAASAALRDERRRHYHEREASAMNTEHHTTPEMDWPQLQPLLDEAVGRLREADREAVLLRFFQGKSHREVGAELGLTEVLARKRVERALDKLRLHLSRRGVTVSSATLGATITTHSVQGAPPGLAAGMAHASLAQAAQTGVAGTFLKGLSMTTKTKMTLVTVTLLIIASIPITLESRQITRTENGNAELARQTNLLQAEMNLLSARLRNVQAGTPSDATTAGGIGYIPVNLEAIKKQDFSIVDQNYQLSGAAAGLLGLTADENVKVQNILTELQSRILARERATVREIALKDIKDPLVGNFLKEYPGTQTAYEIPPMSVDDLAAFQQWFTGDIISAIGAARGDVFVSKAIDDHHTQKLWLSPGSHVTIVFSDYFDAGGTPKTAYYSSYQTAKGGGGGFGEGGSKGAVPAEWAFLFAEVNGGKRTTAPAPAP